MSKKVCNFAPDLSKMTIYTPRTYVPIFESSSPTPTADVVPHEALSIREMLIRTDRGQRLDVHTRMRSENMPDNMYPENEVDRLHESLNDAPPDGMQDRVDVEIYQAELEERKRVLESKRKKNRQDSPDPSPGVDKDPKGKTTEGDRGSNDE